LSAGQYFDVKIEYEDISKDDFEIKIDEFRSSLNDFFAHSKKLESEITDTHKSLSYE
jgi:type I restriction enzyme M protein